MPDSPDELKKSSAIPNELEQLQKKLKAISFRLDERSREVACFHFLSEYAQNQDLVLEELLRKAVDLICHGFESTCSVCARVRLNDIFYQTSPYRETDLIIASPILMNHKHSGSMHLYLQEDAPIPDREIYIKDKQALVTSACRFIGIMAGRMELDQEKRKLQEKSLYMPTDRSVSIHPAAESREIEFENMIGKSEAMQQIYELIRNTADTEESVCITGESGSGKELATRAVHNLSRRKEYEFLAVNCGAIPEALFENEFFGYVKGAFTGAASDTKGYMHMAHNGTLFLDEVGELPQKMQVKLLRALDSGTFVPLGGNRKVHSDVRLITATSRNLEAEVKNGRIREDFYFRIHVIPIAMPPLRERKEDIPLLVDHFFQSIKTDDPHTGIPETILNRMMEYDWPGNVRELKNVVSGFYHTGRLHLFGLKPENQKPDPLHIPLSDGCLRSSVEAYEKELIQKTLHEHNWHRTTVAEKLNITRNTLFRKIKKYGLEPIQT